MQFEPINMHKEPESRETGGSPDDSRNSPEQSSPQPEGLLDERELAAKIERLATEGEIGDAELKQKLAALRDRISRGEIPQAEIAKRPEVKTLKELWLKFAPRDLVADEFTLERAGRAIFRDYFLDARREPVINLPVLRRFQIERVGTRTRTEDELFGILEGAGITHEEAAILIPMLVTAVSHPYAPRKYFEIESRRSADNKTRLYDLVDTKV